ncbi:hypothetical protein SNOG_04722 [Parastagonospora nodorum SN15]|uniref:Uncharacterized protein n=1 Tax=Phaeosphaeria nodorum (strain SN15 / ATCC MYA-4574 / FGSC 10173) TaxID=321614 RepID=Q0UU42_PHANO|nr:hypothetical protein SNOG_04722 [Parastagonospora nodorum SN15]EAT88482.1 hypothetical protein SNOG_04722 [Parastagonospora nodorum SN15]
MSAQDLEFVDRPPLTSLPYIVVNGLESNESSRSP